MTQEVIRVPSRLLVYDPLPACGHPPRVGEGFQSAHLLPSLPVGCGGGGCSSFLPPYGGGDCNNSDKLGMICSPPNACAHSDRPALVVWAAEDRGMPRSHGR
jgi:hypothetical protein